MSEILVCPVCGKEYKSKFHYDKHVEAHGEHEVTWTPEGIPEIEEMVAKVPEPEVIIGPILFAEDDEESDVEEEPEPVFDPEKAKIMAEAALAKLNSFIAILGLHLESQREKWNDAIGDLKAAIGFL